MVRALYSTLLTLAMPAVLTRMAWRGRRQKAYREHWSERLGQVPEHFPKGALIIHACSVGETQAASVLVQWMQAERPEIPLILTHTTPTGRARGETLMPGLHRCYLPFDLPWVVAGWLDKLQPCAVVLMETEVWPNLINACSSRNIPVSLANARMSERSARGYEKARSLMQPAWRKLHWVGCQYQADADRLLALGVRPEVTEVAGNLKMAIELAPEVVAKAQALRSEWAAERPVWIAGSTHPGEEVLILDIHKQLSATFPELLLILAPRHPERAQEIEQLMAERSLSYVKRSEQRVPDASTSVVLLDTLGELGMFYAVSDYAFVGGSLVPHGGHNPFEPVQVGLPTWVGPHMFNFETLLEGLLDSSLVAQVENAEALEQSVHDALKHRQQLLAAGQQHTDTGHEDTGEATNHAAGLKSSGHWLAAILPAGS
ncbi:lipid IV(A) 3-deoxy-D-manno-octulosonic acid transferase [Pokkaliibacter sp. CJK22405]|uniref:lipid IV(A) 3-deoxy-D-manno-octulosonic acid transferase n=1 Tax=Pokkaliibacter sp. CJK22405 TaxID=3384615 RepID=UPI0039852040